VLENYVLLSIEILYSVSPAHMHMCAYMQYRDTLKQRRVVSAISKIVLELQYIYH